MGEKAKGSALAKKLEANRQNHFFLKKKLSANHNETHIIKQLTAPCSRPYTCHQQDPYPVPVCIGMSRWIAVAVVVADKGTGNAKSNDRGKEDKGEKESMSETDNTFRRHSGFVSGRRCDQEC